MLDATALTNGEHPFLILTNGTEVPNFNQSQTSGNQVWNVPSSPAVSANTYVYKCGNHPWMTNYIRVFANCTMDTAGSGVSGVSAKIAILFSMLAFMFVSH